MVTAISTASMCALSEQSKGKDVDVLLNSECRSLTDEYKLARTDAYRDIRVSYKQCRKATSSAIFWRASAKCVKKYIGADGAVSSHCSHVGNGDENDLEHCDIFKPSKKQILDYLDELMEKRKIKKCVK